LSSSIAFSDFSSERAAIYTLAPFESSTYKAVVVSKKIEKRKRELSLVLFPFQSHHYHL
jgi:hypothetical protein